ncbi:MAG: hypothetical protein DHS20C17_10910 [Cyclobacteriaceae bacterium]|nr:MAG: hypothetical protein DHS20C17_10910 [Cyclobacteriaceae bacterium]
MKYTLLVLLFLGSFTLAQAQSKKEKKRQKKETQAQKELPSSREPGSSDNLFRGQRKMSKSSGSLEAKAVQEYQQRMKQNARKYNKIDRIKDRPQYSDPTYFGHKRKPKKRPVGKRKFCKECGIVH